MHSLFVESRWIGAELSAIATQTGGPAVQKPTRTGFGSLVIERVIGQLGGSAQFDWRPEGLSCEMTIPV